MEELPVGTTDEELLENCFGETAPRTKGKRTIKVKDMSASADLFAKIIKASQATATLANDIEIDIETSNLIRQTFTADLQVQPTVTYFKNANAYRITTTYSYSFAVADGRPRKIVVSLRYFEENGKPPQEILADPMIEWQGPPPWVKYKMRAGTSYRETLTIRFTK